MALSPMQMLQMMGDPRLRQMPQGGGRIGPGHLVPGAGLSPVPSPQMPAIPRPRTPPPVAPLSRVEAPQSGPGGLLGLLQRPGVGDALMAVGMNMMAQADSPGTFAGALGRSLPAGVQAYEQAGQQQAMQQLLEQMPPAQRAVFEALPPAEQQRILSQRMTQPMQQLQPGAVGVDSDPITGQRQPGLYNPPLPGAPKDPWSEGQYDSMTRSVAAELNPELGPLDFDREQWAWINDEVDRRRKAEAAAGVGTLSEGLHEAYKEDVIEAATNRRQARGALQRFAQMRDYIGREDFESGGFQSATLGFRQFFADMFGLDLDELDVQEAFLGMSNQTALFLKPEAMTGQMSDNDLKFLARAAPNLANTPEGNLLLISFYEKVANQQIRWAMALERYIDANPTGRGLWDFEQQWYEANPLFTAPGMTDEEIEAAADAAVRSALDMGY